MYLRTRSCHPSSDGCWCSIGRNFNRASLNWIELNNWLSNYLRRILNGSDFLLYNRISACFLERGTTRGQFYLENDKGQAAQLLLWSWTELSNNILSRNEKPKFANCWGFYSICHIVEEFRGISYWNTFTGTHIYILNIGKTKWTFVVKFSQQQQELCWK